MELEVVHVDLGGRSYAIACPLPTSPGIGHFARQRARGDLAAVISDENVAGRANNVSASLRETGFQVIEITVPPGERSKSLDQAALIYDRLAEARADRTTLIAAVGGGVVGDLAGFVAATYARGLPLLMVPTTLLAMVDSAVGGKVAVNHRRIKNLIGAFLQPIGVWCDPEALDTLPEREYRSGLSEVVKYGIALDAEFFIWLEHEAEAILRRETSAIRHLVIHCCRLKAKIVQQDEREETGRRAVLNYGHTFGHALEAATEPGTWLHGEAVAVGMSCAVRLAQRRGLLQADPDLVSRQDRMLQRLGLPVKLPACPIDDFMAFLGNDKKHSGGKLHFVLPRRLGYVELVAVPAADVRRLLEDLLPAGKPPGDSGRP